MIGIIYGEAANPRKTIPKASLNVILRICVLYIFGVFVLGLAVSPKNQWLVDAHSTDANASPFVIAIGASGIQVWPSFVNACLPVFTVSRQIPIFTSAQGISIVWLKMVRHPEHFFISTKNKVSIVGCVVGSLLRFLPYMNTKKPAATVFGYITSAASVFGKLNWFYILIVYLRYDRALKAQGISLSEVSFRMWFQPYAAYVALFFVIIITIFNGYSAFITTFHYKTFITSYICYTGKFPGGNGVQAVLQDSLCQVRRC